MSTVLREPKQHIASSPGVCGGKPCIAGTRIRVWDVASLVQSGHSLDDVLVHYPQLTLADVYAAMAYYYDNREGIESQVAEDERFVQSLHQRLGPDPLEQKLAEDGKPTP